MSASSSSPPLSTQPRLTPQYCYNTTALQDFLRLSRATVDDTISSSLNALLTPSRSSPFNPSSTSHRSYTPSTPRNVPAPSCTQFQRQILFPSWKVREDVLRYCSSVAEGSAGTTDSQIRGRQSSIIPSSTDVIADGDGDASPSARTASSHAQTSRNYWGQPQTVNERLDPYSARDYEYTREEPQQVLRDVVEKERGVERVVRARTWGVLNARCTEGTDDDGGREGGWEKEWQRWQNREL